MSSWLEGDQAVPEPPPSPEKTKQSCLASLPPNAGACRPRAGGSQARSYADAGRTAHPAHVRSQPGGPAEGGGGIRDAAGVGRRTPRPGSGRTCLAGPELHSFCGEPRRSGRWVLASSHALHPPHPRLNSPFPFSEMGWCRQVQRFDDPAVLDKAGADPSGAWLHAVSFPWPAEPTP